MLKKNLKIIVILIVILGVSISLSIFNFKEGSNLGSIDSCSQDVIKSQTFSKDDYTPIIEEEKQALGNITITNLNFNESGFFNYSQNYPNLEDDLISGALIMSYNGTKFKNTLYIAKSDNLDNSAIESNKITVLLNESIFVKYDTSIGNSEGYLIYGPRLYPCKLSKLFIRDNLTSDIEIVNETKYNIDESNFLFFNYNEYFNRESDNFTMYLFWEYNITIQDWYLYQNPQERVLIKEKEQTVKPKFYYDFQVLGFKFSENPTTDEIPADNLKIHLLVNPPDKNLLNDHVLSLNNETTTDFLNGDKSINITISGNYKVINLNFTTNYTVRFNNPVSESWAIDRLVSMNNIRERIYFPSLISGPKHIVLKYLMIYEETITLDQVIANSSLFDRDVQYFDLNVSTIEDEFKQSLIFTKNAVKKQGLKIIIPYMINGEICPFIIKYETNKDIIIKVTDNIGMPLVGVNIKLFYYNKSYGTYISNDLIQPMAPLFTNDNGEGIIRNIPNGNYTVFIYQNEELIKQGFITTNYEITYIKTNIIHFPILILILGTINGVFILIGFIFYLNYKKR